MTQIEDGKRGGIRSKEKIVHDMAKVLLVALAFAGLALLLKNQHIREHYFNIHTWRTILQEGNFVGGRALGALLFVLSGGVLISLGIPRIWVSAFGGAVYGAVLGSALSILSALIGAMAVYQVGRSLLLDVVNRRVGGKLELWKKRFRENAFWWVLYGRLFPFSNSTVKSLLCGSCNVPFLPYLSASFLGFIPHTVIFASFGSGGAKGNFFQITLGFALMLLTFLSRNFLESLFPGKGDKGVDVPEAGKENMKH